MNLNGSKWSLLLIPLFIVLMSSTSAYCEDFIKTASDPSTIGIGARSIGMGKCFVGLSDDVTSIFLNPAGLADLKSWQVMSMQTKLLNEIDYLSFAGTYNTEYGTFGLGYVSATIGGSFATGITLVEDRGIIFPLITEEAINYSSSVLLLSYGSNARRFLDWGWFSDWGWLDKVSLGTSFKMFTQGLSGGGITDGTLSGYDMDFGALYKPISWLSFGYNQQNALPVSMGGKITSASGVEHSIPSVTKLGVSFKALGTDGYYPFDQQLYCLFDMDYSISRADYPILFRTGFEWWPSNYLALRLGVDQDVIGKDTSVGYNVDSNLTGGAGIRYNGFSFDYAYHKYGAVSDNDTSYLSLSYSSPIDMPAATKEAPVIEREKDIQIFYPQDKLITNDEAVNIIGIIGNIADVGSVMVNGSTINTAANGSFESTYPLSLGKNTFEITVLGKDGVRVASTKLRILRMVYFKDVPKDYWAKSPIEGLATLGIIGGYPDGTFKPNKSINRAELTTLLVKAKAVGTAEPTATSFYDVSKKHWASYYIQNAVDMGMVTGYPDKTFRPAKSLNRAEGVTILSRFAQLKEPEELTEGPFTDVPGRHWAAKSISAARSAGMLTYLNDKPFVPNKEMTRAEAAEILAKTPFAITKLQQIQDFETY
jgi:hypothetical protein